MKRDQFVFFRSWLDGVRLIKNKSARCDAYDAIINYALDGQEANVEQLAPAAAIAFIMAKPVIDSGRRKAEAGKKGGEKTVQTGDKQTPSKPEATKKQTGSNEEANGKQTPSNKNKNRKEEEKTPPPSYEGCGDKKNPPPPRSPAARAYMEKISATPSTASMEELLDFERELGTGVCLRAIDAALDANARSWSYIRAILRTKRDQGVRSPEDWDRLEAQRMDSRARRQKADAAPAAFDSGDIDWMFEDREEEDGHGPDHTG